MGDRGAGLLQAAWGSALGTPRWGLRGALQERSPLPRPHPSSSACTCASRWAEAGKGAHAVNAGGSWGTGGSCTVIQVLVTAWATPATHTHAVEAPGCVLAGATVSAARGTLGFTFIYVFRAVPACRGQDRRRGLALGWREGALPPPRTCSGRLTLPGLWAEAGVGAQPIQAGGPVLALVPDTVIRIHLAVQARET